MKTMTDGELKWVDGLGGNGMRRGISEEEGGYEPLNQGVIILAWERGRRDYQLY